MHNSSLCNSLQRKAVESKHQEYISLAVGDLVRLATNLDHCRFESHITIYLLWVKNRKFPWTIPIGRVFDHCSPAAGSVCRIVAIHPSYNHRGKQYFLRQVDDWGKSDSYFRSDFEALDPANRGTELKRKNV